MEEIDKFLEKHKPPNLNQEEIEIPNGQVTIMEIQTALKNLPRKNKNKNKKTGPHGFTGEFYQKL